MAFENTGIYPDITCIHDALIEKIETDGEIDTYLSLVVNYPDR